jgi:hypothetical protein
MSSTPTHQGLTRRQLLQAAGGITFLALAPERKGVFAATFGRGRADLPTFSALPYLQPGPTGISLAAHRESVVLAWQTDGIPAHFDVSFGVASHSERKAEVHSVERLGGDLLVGDKRRNYSVTLDGLPLNARYHYSVRMDGKPLLAGYGTTRKPRGVKARFVSFGDNSCGSPSDHAIAFYAYQARPDFVMNTGDNVYDHGLDHEYAQNFFPVYNSNTASPAAGAPLLRSVPFYSVIANHDLTGNDPHHSPVGDFTRHPDGFAYFTNLYLPLNGPTVDHLPLAIGDPAAIAQFKACAGSRYPTMMNYSYDYGDAHFLCLDSNLYVDPTDAALQAWIKRDLLSTDAAWKIVVYHHPAYNVGFDHYREQHMRVLSPLFEQFGVDLVLNGHEHNYQRSRPLRFEPNGEGSARNLGRGDRLVPGKFTVDRRFDGKSVTKPDGIIYIVTGAGGNDLYDPDSNNNPARWVHPEDDNADYVAVLISDRHSLSVFDMDHQSLTLTQIDEHGAVIDTCRMTKA